MTKNVYSLITKSEREKNRACIVIGGIITIGFSFLTILFVNCNQKKISSLKSNQQYLTKK